MRPRLNGASGFFCYANNEPYEQSEENGGNTHHEENNEQMPKAESTHNPSPFPRARLRHLTLEVSGRCHNGRQSTVARRSGPLDRIVRARRECRVANIPKFDVPKAKPL